MAQTFSGTLHLASAAAGVTTYPATLVIWTNNGGGQGRRIMQLNGGGGSETQCFGVLLDVTAASNKLAVYRSATSGTSQSITSAASATGSWQHYGCVFTSTSAVAAYLNGGNKGTGTAVIAPSTLAATLISGRPSDFAFGIGGQAAHAAVYSRALSDAEMSYLGSGGNPRALNSLVNYWKIATIGGTPESPVIDQIGSNDLTPSGTMGAGTSDPNIESIFIGPNVGAQNYTVGAAITSINVGVSGSSPKFDDVSSPGTATLKQLGTATATGGTTSASGTAVREFAVSSLTGITVGGYIKITSGGTPTRVLATNATAVTVVVSTNQTFSSGAAIFSLAVNSLSIAGLAISSNVFSGTPVANSTNTLCFFRFTCTGNSALVADTDLFTMTITGGGGGGGGGLQMPAGAFAGGFIGG